MAALWILLILFVVIPLVVMHFMPGPRQRYGRVRQFIAIVGVILTLVQCFITYARWYNNYEPDIPQVRTLEPEIVEIMIQELTQTAAAPTP
ncbi:MAG: hypothetical protein AAFU54_13605 [Chloroflexota bacterium]